MTGKKGGETYLEGAIADPGFTPRRADVRALIELLATCEEGRVAEITRAVLRAGERASLHAIGMFTEASDQRTGQERTVLLSRIARLGSRLGAETDAARAAWRVVLVGALEDDDPRVVRAAANALGRLGKDAGVEQALLGAIERVRSGSAPNTDPPIDIERSLVEALGKVGSGASLAMLGDAAASEATRRASQVAIVRLSRDEARASAAPPTPSQSIVIPVPVETRLVCREGLETMLAVQAPPGFTVTRVGIGRVRGMFHGPLEALFGSVVLEAAFVLAEQRIPRRVEAEASIDEDAMIATLVAAVCTPAATTILAAASPGPSTYRIEWANAGHRRALTRHAAAAIDAAQPALRNDPRAATWQLLVEEEGRSVRVLLVPRRVGRAEPHPRVESTEGASHPTIAAALVIAAELVPNDVVWDPFVGGGTELVECLRRGGSRLVVLGSDIDATALEVARRNLERAGFAGGFTLVEADARKHVPSPAPTLVITNPPMGRRVQRTRNLAIVLDTFVLHAARVLRPGGRLVWLSPFPERTRKIAERASLVTRTCRMVDMGGFEAELQRFDKPARGPVPRPRA